MGCMKPLPAGREECGFCGYPAGGINPEKYLQVRTTLSDRYLVGRVLEAGGDSALYMGYDTVQNAPVTIREFFPDTLCGRGADSQVSVIAGCEKTYQEYLEHFRAHARAMARLRDLPTMIPLYDIFDANNTAYTVTEFCQGVTLEETLKQAGGKMKWDQVRPLIMPLLTALSAMHSAGLYHLGICPQNILVGLDGRVHLKNFIIPEARMVSSDLKPQLLSGFSAPEQYQFEQSYSAATDVYGITATIFCLLTGNPPADGASRARSSADLLMPADVAKELPAHVKSALFHGLQVRLDQRISSIAQLQERLSETPAVSALRQADSPASTPAPRTAEKKPQDTASSAPDKPKKSGNRLKYGLLIFIACFLVLALIAFGVLLILFPNMLSGNSQDSSVPSSPSGMTVSSSTSTTSSTQWKDPMDSYAVSDVKGKNYYDIKDEKQNGDMVLEIESLVFDDSPAGTIISQSPAPESQAPKGSTIHVVISNGPEQRTLPDLSGWPQEYAKTLLEQLGYKVDVLELAVSDYEKGLVQDTSPVAGSKVSYGDTITLRVSNQTQETEPTEPDNPFPFW